MDASVVVFPPPPPFPPLAEDTIGAVFALLGRRVAALLGREPPLVETLRCFP